VDGADGAGPLASAAPVSGFGSCCSMTDVAATEKADLEGPLMGSAAVVGGAAAAAAASPPALGDMRDLPDADCGAAADNDGAVFAAAVACVGHDDSLNAEAVLQLHEQLHLCIVLQLCSAR